MAGADVDAGGHRVRRVADGITGARRVVLPGVDHFVPMRAPVPFLDAVFTFLEEARPS